MRKPLSMLAAMALLLSFAAAAETYAAGAAGRQPAAKASRARQLTGRVEAVDAAAGTITVKGRRGAIRLTAGKKVTLDGVAPGDRVFVRYTGDIVSRVRKVSARKAAKKEGPENAGKPAGKQAAPDGPHEER